MNWEGFKVDVWMGFDFQAISWKGEFFCWQNIGSSPATLHSCPFDRRALLRACLVEEICRFWNLYCLYGEELEDLGGEMGLKGKIENGSEIS